MAMHPYIPSLPTFSPEGRLYEVEYAMEEVAKALPAVAILAEDGIVAAAEQENMFSLLAEKNLMPPIFRVDNDNACVITGLMTDAYRLLSAMRSYSQRHRTTYGELMPTERLVDHICCKKQSYTMYTGKRPFGISVIYMGWDTERVWQLYQSDPSGTYNAWQSVCIGRNAHRAQRYLYQMQTGQPLPDLSWAHELAIKAIKVAMGDSEVSGATVKMATMQRKNNTTDYQILEEVVVQDLCTTHCDTPQASGSSYSYDNLYKAH